MIRTVEAVVDPSGNVRLLEDVQLPGPRRALVTILDDAPRSEETALLSEGALADWSRPEEDAACHTLSRRDSCRSVPIVGSVSGEAASGCRVGRRWPRRLDPLPSHQQSVR